MTEPARPGLADDGGEGCVDGELCVCLCEIECVSGVQGGRGGQGWWCTGTVSGDVSGGMHCSLAQW